MNSNEGFEVMAELFYRETGMMAPGKDCPAGFGPSDYNERVEAWKKWIEEFYSNLFTKHFA